MEVHPEDRDDQERTGAVFSSVVINRAILQDMGQIEMAFKSIQWVAFVVLVIGCLNVGGMILVKGYSRLQELAMRKAMGASVLRLSRQIYVEIFIYFLLGGLGSLAILKGAYWVSLYYLRFDEIPWASEWLIDSRSMYITLFIALGADPVEADLHPVHPRAVPPARDKKNCDGSLTMFRYTDRFT